MPVVDHDSAHQIHGRDLEPTMRLILAVILPAVELAGLYLLWIMLSHL